MFPLPVHWISSWSGLLDAYRLEGRNNLGIGRVKYVKEIKIGHSNFNEIADAFGTHIQGGCPLR